ncbi:helix-turn-helix domain-containing protein [Flavobacterium sp. 7A]|uniref:helix-turn-helix domain-containing protein n=1 Tax=Flavobacterium sp. 7A TaxID=2940571 RepID=UPI0022279DB9|nr:helix-turn-helix transcriptional regulator [Flavobacterium sp. 7A]MCW2118484.1 transcriptional regulator with XRE-family HTH domain [Flavobacterium sp. 7A]
MSTASIYLKIKESREKKRHTVEYVAIQMEMSVQLYLKVETGAVDLKISKLDKLAKVLGMKKSELLGFN